MKRSTSLYIGLDVHRDSISVGYFRVEVLSQKNTRRLECGGIPRTP